MGYKVVEESVVEQRDRERAEVRTTLDDQHKGGRLRGGRRRGGGWRARRGGRHGWLLTFPLVSLVMNCALGISFGSGSVGVRRVSLLRELGELRYRENWTFGTPGGPESRFRVLESEKGKNAS